MNWIYTARRPGTPPLIDMNDTVKMFCGTRQIGGNRYSVHVPATSFDEAQALAQQIGAVIDGQVIEEQAIGLCAKCAGPIVTANYENLEPTQEEEWPEEFI